jgi:hypothetical protein
MLIVVAPLHILQLRLIYTSDKNSLVLQFSAISNLNFGNENAGDVNVKHS